MIAVSALFSGFSCGQKKRSDQLLNAYEILDSSAEELIERFGEPAQHSEGRYIRWKSINGVLVFVFFEKRKEEGIFAFFFEFFDKQKANYVAYTFEEMESFDEARAFQIIGIEPPKEGAKYISKNKAKRWEPFGEYDKLTVSMETRVISIGTDPLRVKRDQKKED